MVTVLKRLISGNQLYLNSSVNNGDISPSVRVETSKNGQHPYAVVVTCSDSRVIPEAIFSAGIGELFVIRVAGNVIGEHELGSIEYAVEHLGCKLIVVLGHTHCGAVGAAIAGVNDGHVASLTGEIRKAIGNEKDDLQACILNVNAGVNKISESLKMDCDTKAIGAVYDIESGKVSFEMSI
ncbi:MAG: carbonic anhydrase [Clostridia bacterium]|nr:carbonic anhydrase [Clostridia bacterium]